MTFPKTLPKTVRVFALLACVVVTACRFGAQPSEIAWVNLPEGAHIALRVTGEPQDRVGELLAVGDDGIMMRGDKITRVYWNRVSAIDVEKLSGDYDLLRGERASAERRLRLALISRFPQGLSDELLSRLLAAHQQTAVEELK